MSILDKIIFKPLATDQYCTDEVPKVQIYLHHTAGSADPYEVLNWWASTPEKIGTSFVIAGKPKKNSNWKDGDILQVFNTGFWAWHLGLKEEHIKVGGQYAQKNPFLNKHSIGIEICNWGGLTKRDDGYYTYVNSRIPTAEVVDLGTSYRGYRYYHKYTDAQLENVQELLRYLCSKWNVPALYRGDEIFDVHPLALQGAPGIWTHTSVRPDKNDCSPQPNFIDMLRNL